jgi:hypothetical protein
MTFGFTNGSAGRLPSSQSEIVIDCDRADTRVKTRYLASARFAQHACRLIKRKVAL